MFKNKLLLHIYTVYLCNKTILNKKYIVATNKMSVFIIKINHNIKIFIIVF